MQHKKVIYCIYFFIVIDTAVQPTLSNTKLKYIVRQLPELFLNIFFCFNILCAYWQTLQPAKSADTHAAWLDKK
jgi:hypothetical protein